MGARQSGGHVSGTALARLLGISPGQAIFGGESGSALTRPVAFITPVRPALETDDYPSDSCGDGRRVAD